VDQSSLTVKNMNGDIALNGTVPSYPQYREAAAAARRVQGVTKVHNHLMVVLPASDYRDDPMLTTAANNALALNVTVPSDVEARASGGNVWLTGTVACGFQRANAEETIAGLTGVRNITNDVEVFSDVEAADVTVLVQGARDWYALSPWPTLGEFSQLTLEAVGHCAGQVGLDHAGGLSGGRRYTWSTAPSPYARASMRSSTNGAVSPAKSGSPSPSATG